ncbi:hypothetical protein [Dongia rigui]|uniref:Methyltransferase domain-containing protein n=1 Tax=Dongia rigui TaxID=940149 RepID=A0ABU5DV15_9PROT|nr:hypothetical protein [Dongia rigui]MDY0870436.1 hypothetical protein [Dongia rigui]
MAHKFTARRWWRTFRRYIGWRIRNPFAPYEDYYVHTVMKKIRHGDGHPAIGSAARPVREHTELLDFLRKYGLQPNDVAVDYGCGSLRLGTAVMNFLEPGKYWGVDITDEFYKLGLDRLDPAWVAAKAPNLGVINPATLAKVRADKPRVIASWHVCSKVPEARLDSYIGSIVSLMSPGSTALVHFPETAERRQLSGLAWASPRSLLETVALRHAPSATISFDPLTETEIDGIRQTLLVIRT